MPEIKASSMWSSNGGTECPPSIPNRYASDLSGAREGISCTAQLEGIVEHGDARGCELGYPTANISVQDREIRGGVWAGIVHLGREGLRETYPAAISRGRRPTYKTSNLLGEGSCRLLQSRVQRSRASPCSVSSAVQVEPTDHRRSSALNDSAGLRGAPKAAKPAS